MLRSLRRLVFASAGMAALLTGLPAHADAGAPAATPSAAQQAQLPPLPEVDVPFTRFVLDNGLTLIVHEDRKAPIVAVNVWYHVGSKNEPRGRSGFAHLFEHLMFTGSENFNDEFFKATELLGATNQNGTTNTDRTNYYQTVPTSALDSVLWLESDRMGHLLGAVDQARLDQERGVVQNEKRSRENQPYGRVWNAITAATYPDDHPYGHTIIGEMADLEAARLEDVQDWFRTYYGPANATIVLAGDISPEEAREKVERYFGAIPPGPPVTQPARMIAPMTGAQREIMYDRVGQPRLYKVWNVPPGGEADTDYLGMLGQVLSSGRTSRLYRRLVHEDQIATQVSAGVSESEIGSQFQITVTGKAGEDMAALEAVVDEEMTRLLRDGPSADELERARTVVGASFVRGMEGISGKADLLAEGQVFHDDAGAWHTSYDRLLAAGPGDLVEAGRTWLSSGSYALEVRPFPEYAARGEDVDRAHGVPAAGAAPVADFPNIHEITLSNGLKVMLVERDSVPTVAVNLIFDAGAAVDPDDHDGLAVLTAAALTSGTEDLDGLQISDRLQLLGSTLGAGSGTYSTTVSMTALSSRIGPSLELFADIVENPAFRPEDFARVQAMQIAGIQQSMRSPGAVANRVLATSLHGPDRPEGRPAAGSEASVGALTPAEAAAWHAAWFRPDNATLVVVGDLSAAELQPELERTLGRWRAPSAPLPVRPEPAARPAPGARPHILLVDRPGPQSTIVGGRITAPFDPATEPAIDAMNTVLGGGFTSRINSNLRVDKQWAYGAGGGVGWGRGDRTYSVSAAVQADKTAESLVELDRELREVVSSRPITETELAAARASIVLGMAGGWETNGGIMGTLATIVAYDIPQTYFDAYAPRVSATTVDQAEAAARQIVGSGPTTWVVVGDRADLEPRLRALDLGDVEVVDVYGRPID